MNIRTVARRCLLEVRRWFLRLVGFPSWLVQQLLRGYQLLLSPLLGPRCKYYPTCSAYALRAFKFHGLFKGGILSFWRLLRCNPLSDGGVDHVPLPGQWVNPWTEPGSITEESYLVTYPGVHTRKTNFGYHEGKPLKC